MTNVFSLSRIKVAGTVMSDLERMSMVRHLGNLAQDHPYPLSRVLNGMSVLVRDYNLEDVTLKDLTPTGYMISANYPTYGIRWIFRLEGRTVMGCPQDIPENDLLALIQRGVRGLGLGEHSARFGFRYVRDLGSTACVDSVQSDDTNVIVQGFIQTLAGDQRDQKEYRPFTMIFSKL